MKATKDYDYRVEFGDGIGQFFQFKENVRAYVLAIARWDDDDPKYLDLLLDAEGSLSFFGGTMISVVKIEPGSLDYNDGGDLGHGGPEFRAFMEEVGSHYRCWR